MERPLALSLTAVLPVWKLKKMKLMRRWLCALPGGILIHLPGRKTDRAEIFSGVFEGQTTGAPISLLISNREADSSKYEPIKDQLRPGHANFTYLEKYGIFDYRGGGRSSARETACRVAAGAIARKLLRKSGIQITAYLKQVGEVEAVLKEESLEMIRTSTYQSAVFCPDEQAGCPDDGIDRKGKVGRRLRSEG